MNKALLSLLFLSSLIFYQNCSDTFDASRLSQSSTNSSAGAEEEAFDYSSLKLEIGSYSVLQGNPIDARVLTMGENLDIRMTLSCIDAAGAVKNLEITESSCSDKAYSCAAGICLGVGSARIRMEAYDKKGEKQLDISSLPISVLSREKTLVNNVSLAVPANAKKSETFKAIVNVGPEISSDGDYEVQWGIPSGCSDSSNTIYDGTNAKEISLLCSSEGLKEISVKVTSLNYTGAQSSQLYIGEPILDISIFAPSLIYVGEVKSKVTVLNIDPTKGVDSIQWTVSDPKCKLDSASTAGVVNYISCSSRPASGAVTLTAKIKDNIFSGEYSLGLEVAKGKLSITVLDVKDVEKNQGFILNSSISAYGSSMASSGFNYDWKICDNNVLKYSSQSKTGTVMCGTTGLSEKIELHVYNDNYDGKVSGIAFKVFSYEYISKILRNPTSLTYCESSITTSKLASCTAANVGKFVDCCDEYGSGNGPFPKGQVVSQAINGGVSCLQGKRFTCTQFPTQ